MANNRKRGHGSPWTVAPAEEEQDDDDAEGSGYNLI
jgi:hypothetical protein